MEAVMKINWLAAGYLISGQVAFRLGSGAAVNDLVCKEIGRFPHPTWCGGYVDCLPGDGDQEGELVPRVGSCFGFPYSASKRRCVSHDEQPGCLAKGSRNALPPIPSLAFLCDNKPTGCLHCNLAYQCIDGAAYVTVCGNGETCSEEPDFGGGACLSYDFNADNSVCECLTLGLLADSYNDTYYHFCDPKSAPVTIETYQCPQDTKYDDVAQDCTSDPVVNPPTVPACQGTGTQVNPNDCSWAYTCLPDGTAKSTYCNETTYYDLASGECKEKCSLVSGPVDPTTLCPGVGVNKDPSDCTKYHLCTLANEPPYKTLNCPSGLFFDEIVKKCVSGTFPSACSNFDYSLCPGHDC